MFRPDSDGVKQESLSRCGLERWLSRYLRLLMERGVFSATASVSRYVWRRGDKVDSPIYCAEDPRTQLWGRQSGEITNPHEATTAAPCCYLPPSACNVEFPETLFLSASGPVDVSYSSTLYIWACRSITTTSIPRRRHGDIWERPALHVASPYAACLC